MKKIISVFALTALCLIFTACGGKKSDIKPITSGIAFTAEIELYNECYQADVIVAENGNTEIKLTFPDTINGLTLNFEDDTVTSKYNGLEYKCEISALPEGIACTKLYEILKDTSKENTAVTAENNRYYISGDTGKLKYRLFVGATGLPISAEETESGFSVNFKNVTIKK